MNHYWLFTVGMCLIMGILVIGFSTNLALAASSATQYEEDFLCNKQDPTHQLVQSIVTKPYAIYNGGMNYFCWDNETVGFSQVMLAAGPPENAGQPEYSGPPEGAERAEDEWQLQNGGPPKGSGPPDDAGTQLENSGPPEGAGPPDKDGKSENGDQPECAGPQIS
ncbi:MAG: hypothetical protein U5L00_13800 [Desulfovermiculus sp.]|nr:hypothetical protein [Desulfovermiculus sp.]